MDLMRIDGEDFPVNKATGYTYLNVVQLLHAGRGNSPENAIFVSDFKLVRGSRKRSAAELLDMYVKQPSQLYKDSILLAGMGRDVMDVCRPCRYTFEVSPIVLMDPLLAEFVENCEIMVPFEADEQLTWQVVQDMSKKYADESKRADALWMCLNSLGFTGIIKLVTKNGKTDGTILGENGSMVLNMEIKNEIGEGGGSIQNVAYAAQHWASGQLLGVRNACRCPTLLIEVAGPDISFSAFCFSGDERAIWEQLTPMFRMAVPQYFKQLYDLARCFSALRVLLLKLMDFYRNLGSF